MTDYSGVTWRVNYGELNEREQFRVGRVNMAAFDAYFPVAQLADLVSTLNAVIPLDLNVLARGSSIQAVKVSDGLLPDVVISPRLDTGTPVEYMRLPLSELSDLLYALGLFQVAVSPAPDDWDNTKRKPLPADVIPTQAIADSPELKNTFAQRAAVLVSQPRRPQPGRLPLASVGPRGSNVGPNAAATVSNAVLYPATVSGALNTDAPWSLWGYGLPEDATVQTAAVGGPYVIPRRAARQLGYSTGPVWCGFVTDAPDIELSYLAGLQSTIRWVVDDEVVIGDPITLTSSGGAQYRYRVRFGLDTLAAPTVAAATGGSLTLGTYRYRVTAVDGNGGETAASSQGSITLSDPGNASVLVSWVAPSNTQAGNADRTVAGYRLYRTDVGGTGTEKLLATVAAGVLSYTDSGTVSTTTACQRIHFGTSGRKQRTVVLEMDRVYFGGITLNKADQIRPLPVGPVRALHLGDSFGYGSSSGYTHYAAVTQAMHMLGWQVDTFALGGTGLIATNPGQGGDIFEARLGDVHFTPDVVVVAAGRNDVGYAPGAITAAATSLIATMRSKWGAAVPIIFVSPWYSASADVASVGAAIKAACLTAGVPYIDALAEGWITGTGAVDDIKGDGNSDIIMATDKVHWTRAGHDSIAPAVAARIISAISADS